MEEAETCKGRGSGKNHVLPLALPAPAFAFCEMMCRRLVACTAAGSCVVLCGHVLPSHGEFCLQGGCQHPLPAALLSLPKPSLPGWCSLPSSGRRVALPSSVQPPCGSAPKSQRRPGWSGELRWPNVPAVAGDSGLVGVGGCFCCANASPPPRAGLSPAHWYCYSYGQFSVFKFCKPILRKISPWCCWLSSRLEIAFPCLKFLPEFQMENVQLHFPS